MRPGGEPLGYSAAVEAVADLADLEALEASCPRVTRSRRWMMWMSSLLAKHLGREAVERPAGAA